MLVGTELQLGKLWRWMVVTPDNNTNAPNATYLYT